MSNTLASMLNLILYLRERQKNCQSGCEKYKKDEELQMELLKEYLANNFAAFYLIQRTGAILKTLEGEIFVYSWEEFWKNYSEIKKEVERIVVAKQWLNDRIDNMRTEKENGSLWRI